ncbi:MAG: cytochrome b [Hyphomicrobiales bacterium]|nr:cytochrome b [Hyphomicrobiales bacterium]
MSEMTTALTGYTLTARVLHWLVAALVLVMVPVGIVIANEWGGPVQDFLYNLHKSIGVTLIPIVILRLFYRLTNPPPPLPSDIPAIQQFAAYTTHWALYALILIQPMIGYLMTSAYPAPVPFFGLFNLPAIWPADRAFSERLSVVHLYLGIAIAAVAAMHISAALYHHFVRKDRVLMRMITG